MGRRRKLKSRFELHDNEINRYLGIFALLFPLSLCVVPWTLDGIGSSSWISAFATLSFGLVIGVEFFFWYHRLAIRVGGKHNLLCVHCRMPLGKPFARTKDRDYRVDGQVPKRCPHCYTKSDYAIKKKGGERSNARHSLDQPF